MHSNVLLSVREREILKMNARIWQICERRDFFFIRLSILKQTLSEIDRSGRSNRPHYYYYYYVIVELLLLLLQFI